MAKLQPKTILNRRIKELKEIFSAVDSDKMKVIEPSLIQAAKMELYIVDLARQLDDAGFVETYQNGENQTGKRNRPSPGPTARWSRTTTPSSGPCSAACPKVNRKALKTKCLPF